MTIDDARVLTQAMAALVDPLFERIRALERQVAALTERPAQTPPADPKALADAVRVRLQS